MMINVNEVDVKTQCWLDNKLQFQLGFKLKYIKTQPPPMKTW